MKLNTFNKKAFFSASLGIVIWFVLIVIAMFYYAGGTRDIPSAIGYTFWGNSFSDLGRTVAWNGLSNITSMILFTFAYGIHITTIIPFFLSFKTLFSGEKFDSKAAKIGSYLGILSSVAFIGILFTPADIANTIHWLFVFIGYPSIIFMGFFYSVALFLGNKFSKVYAYVTLILALIFFLSILIGLIGIVVSRDIMVIGQKFGRISLMIEYLILIFGAWKSE